MENKNSTITAPSRTKTIRELSTKVLDSLAEWSLSEAKLFEIKLCVEEAVRNAIIHGNKSNANKKVKLSYRTEGSNIIIEVEDEGKGYDYRSVPDPTRKENLTKGSGRGVYLIKRLMDKVEHNTAGNVIIMTKRLK